MRSYVDVRLVFYIRQEGNGWIAESEGLRLSANGDNVADATENLKREIHDKVNQPFYYATYEDMNKAGGG